MTHLSSTPPHFLLTRIPPNENCGDGDEKRRTRILACYFDACLAVLDSPLCLEHIKKVLLETSTFSSG